MAFTNVEEDKQHHLSVLKDVLKERKHLDQIKLAVGDDERAFQHVMAAYSYVALSEPNDKTKMALYHCDPLSIHDAILTAANVGLRIDNTGLCYLVPYKKNARLSIGYKGYVYKVKEANPTANFQTSIVFPKDIFMTSSKDGVATYEHEVNPENSFNANWNTAVGVYCYLSYQIAGRFYADLERIGHAEIVKIRSKAKSPGVWSEWMGEQMKKAVIRRATKLGFSMATAMLDSIDNDDYDLLKNGDDATDVTPADKKGGLEARMEQEREARRLASEVKPVIIDNEEKKEDDGRGDVDNPPSTEGTGESVAGSGEHDQQKDGETKSEKTEAGEEVETKAGTTRDDDGEDQKGATADTEGDLSAVWSGESGPIPYEPTDEDKEDAIDEEKSPTQEETKRGFHKLEGKVKRFLLYADTEDAYNAFLSYLQDVQDQKSRQLVLKANRRFMDGLSGSGQEAKVQKLYKTAEQGKI